MLNKQKMKRNYFNGQLGELSWNLVRKRFKVQQNMNSEMQVCLKLQSAAYVYLKEYPNRNLLGRSKIINFTNNETFFEERCLLFVQVCCMLLKIQIQKTQVLLSKSVFIDYNHILFMLYSLDASHEGKLKKVTHGNLINNIIDIHKLIFVKQAPKIADYQYNFFYQNASDLIHYLLQLKDKSDNYYFEGPENRFHIINSQIELTNPNSIMFKFENSHIFKEYFYLLVVSKAIIIKLLAEAEHLKSQDIHNTYCQLIYLQKNLFNIINNSFFVDDVKDCLYSFDKLVIHLLKLMQQENCLILNKREEDKKSTSSRNYTVLDIQFCSNLRRLPSCPTAGDRSEESSGNQNNTFEKKQEKQERRRQKHLFQSIRKFENQINFKVEVTFNFERKYFSIDVQGVSQWCLDECFFNPIFELWSAFNSSWHNQGIQKSEQVVQELKPFKLQLLQRNKNIIIRQNLRMDESCNLVLEIITIVDKIAIIFLLFERVFKHFYKVTQNILLNNEKYYKNIKNKDYVANLVKLHKQALKEYSGLYSKLIFQDKKHYFK